MSNYSSPIGREFDRLTLTLALFGGESLTVPRPPASGESLIVPYCILVARTLRQSLGEVEWLLTASTDISRQVQGGPAPGKSLNSPGESALLINE